MKEETRKALKARGSYWMIRGTVIYIALISLGMSTKVFTGEFATNLVSYIPAMIIFIVGIVILELVDSLYSSD